MTRRLRIGTLFLFFAGMARVLYAEAPPHPPVVFLDVQQGLSNNTVRCVLKDHNGFLWFGTRDGLNRYDGNSFTVFRHQFKDTNSLLSNYVLCLVEDRAGRIWIGTRQGLCIYDPLTTRFATVKRLLPGDAVPRPIDGVTRELADDGHGNMLIGTEDNGLLIYRPGAAAATLIPLNEAGGVNLQYGVHAIKADGPRIWVQVQKKGLCSYDASAGRLQLVNTLLPLAGSLEIVDHVLWTGSGNGLYRYAAATNTYTRVWQFPLNSRQADEIWTLKKDDRGRLLVGTLNGRVLTWDIAAGGMASQPLDDSVGALRYGTIYALCMGEGGSKWIGTGKGGIGVVDPRRSRFHRFPTEFVTCFAEAPDSNLLLGTEGNGIVLYDRHKERFTRLPARFDGEKVITMAADKTGHIWAAAQAGGVYRIDLRTGGADHYYCNPIPGGQESNWVWVVYADHNNDIWATSLRQVSLMGALYRFEPGAGRFVAFDTSLSDIFTLYEDRQGALWGGDLKQLIAIDRVGRRHRYYPMGFTVRCIYEDRRGRLWVGTEGGGLQLFDRQRHAVVARYTTDEGLCNNTVNAILEDSTGALWLSTANGLSRLDPATARFRNYFESDGLQSNEFIYNSALALRSRELAFGGIKGFNLFDPMSIRETNNMPRLLLTGITVNGVPVQKDSGLVSKWGADQVEEIRVPYDKAFLSFDFTAPEFSAPQDIGYAYLMDGWDRKWTDAGHQRRAAYTHLEEGHYVFRVRSTNAEGKWNPAEIRLGITVLPPWYRTIWAYSFYALVIIAVLVLYRKYKARQARLRYEIAIAKHNAEKERSENEKKLSFFTHIAHEFRTPLTLVINPVKDLLRRRGDNDAGLDVDAGAGQMELQTIHRNARRMLSLVDQLLLFRKADSGADRLIVTRLNLIDLAREVYLSFIQQARVKGIRYEFSSERDRLEVVADQEKIEIILFNLVSNALKYTPPGGEVLLFVKEEGENVEVRVTDTGPGIPADAGDRIFERFYQASSTEARPKPGFGIGLFLARQFAVAHHGELSYSSAVGKGSSFLLRLPKGLAHAHDAPAAKGLGEPSELLRELVTEDDPGPSSGQREKEEMPAPLVDERRSMLIIDDDDAMRHYVAGIFGESMMVYEAADGEAGLRRAMELLPDVVISDIRMQEVSGIDVCKALKGNSVSSHIPVVLLTGTLAPDLELEGVEGGADVYLTKPFDTELLRAKVANLLQSRNNVREALFNEITHNQPVRGISAVDKAFLDKCVSIIEHRLDEEDFSIGKLAVEMGVSHSSLYKKVKTLTGDSLNAFIRQVRLRNAAILCINSELNVNEIAARVGIIDRTHFREQFQKVYGMTAAEYIRKYRKPLSSRYTIKKNK